MVDRFLGVSYLFVFDSKRHRHRRLCAAATATATAVLPLSLPPPQLVGRTEHARRHRRLGHGGKPYRQALRDEARLLHPQGGRSAQQDQQQLQKCKHACTPRALHAACLPRAACRVTCAVCCALAKDKSAALRCAALQLLAPFVCPVLSCLVLVLCFGIVYEGVFLLRGMRAVRSGFSSCSTASLREEPGSVAAATARDHSPGDLSPAAHPSPPVPLPPSRRPPFFLRTLQRFSLSVAPRLPTTGSDLIWYDMYLYLTHRYLII